MIKLREPFLQKVHLHIRQDMLQRLWDQYVSTSSAEYGKIELIYLKDALGDLEKQPEQIQLLLHLILNNKKMQLNLIQYPMLVKIGRKQLENNLRRMEQYYTVQLKCSNFMMYRTVKQYFSLLEKAQEDRRRYQEWQKNHQEIEKQKDEYRLISLFSEKLRDYLAEYSVNTLRTMQREFVHSLSETEYRTLAEELIWQERPEILTYFNGWDEAQCENVVRELEKDTGMKQVLSLIPDQPVKESMIAAVEKLEQREFCLFYHQVMKLENVEPQVVIWKENKTEMLSEIDRLESESIQQMWNQMEDMTHLLEQEPLWIQENGSPDRSALQIQQQDIQDLETLRTLEKELLYSISETEYRTFAEKNIWQEKPTLITYLQKCDKDQCMVIVRELEKDIHMRQVLSMFSDRSVKEQLITAVNQLEQKEFRLFYHQVMNLEDVKPQMVIWKENRTEMLSEVDRLESETLQQLWEQIEREEHKFEKDILWLQENEVPNQKTLRTLEKELIYSLLETEYRTLAEELIWQEKPELIAYFKACEKEQCKEIVKQLEKDTYMKQVLSSLKKQSAKKKLVSAAYKLEQKEFSLFYWQVVDLKDVNPQMVIWKKSRVEMLRSIDELEQEHVQKVWAQMESVGSIKGSKHIFAEKMLYLQNQYQQNVSRNFQKQIAVILEENALQSIANIVDIEQLTQDVSIAEYSEKPAGAIEEPKEPEFGLGEREHLVLWDGAYQVIRNLEREQEIRRERIERQQAQVVETYQDAYRQIVRTGYTLVQQQEGTVQTAERIFREQYQEQLTGEEIQNICEWSQALLEIHFAEQGQTESFSPNQGEQLELTHVVNQINHYMEEQYGFGERLILHWQEDVSKDERIRNLLIYIRQLDEELREQFIHYLADMVQLSVQLSSQRKVSAVMQSDRTESAGQSIQSNKQEAVEKMLRIEDRELAEKLLRVEDREFAERLLQIEDRELIEKLLRVEDREFVERLLQIEDREFTKRLLQIEDRDFAWNLLQNNDWQLPDVSYRNLWEWGEVLLFHPEHQQEWEDADILAVPQQEAFSSDEAKQEDIQTQVIRHQIEMAKDRNRLQSLIRQINHQAEIQLVYTDIQLRMPQVQTMLHYAQQLDEKQYGILVKELVQIIKIQKLSYEEPEAAASSAEQPIQGNTHESAGKLLRIEDKEFIEKLLQAEDREFTARLLQINNREFAEKLLQVEDKELAKRLLQIENKQFAGRLLHIKDRELVKKLLRIENRELAERLLQIENKQFAEKLLRIENKEFIEKLLQNDDSQLPGVSYRNLWEWGEALLQHPSFDEVRQEDEQTQIVHQQIEVEKARSHLQSLIRQINHRADVQLVYSDAQLRVPQIQALLQYIRQLDVGQYGAFVKELAQVTMIQRLSYDEPEAAVHTGEVTALLEQRMISYPILERYIQNYEEQRQLELYRDIGRIEQKIFPHAYEKENRQYVTNNSDAGRYVQGITAYGMMPYGGRESTYELVPYETGSIDYGLTLYEELQKEYVQITTYERNQRENRYQPQELEYSVQKTSGSEEDQQRNELRMQQENARIKSAQEQLDKKLKEVEHQLKKVEDSTKAREDVRSFAEQVKQQLYEELHVEKLRRGLI